MNSEQDQFPQGVPYLSLQREYQGLRDEWMQAIDGAGASGAFILGPNVRAFEEEAAAYSGLLDPMASLIIIFLNTSISPWS